MKTIRIRQTVTWITISVALISTWIVFLGSERLRPRRSQLVPLANRMILAKSSGSREAPPTSPPSISGMAIRSATLPGFMLPP